MKKIAMILLCILLVFSASVPFYGETVTEVPYEDSVTLTVDYTNNTPGATVPVESGSAAGTLPNDTEFSAEKLPEDASAFRVYPVQSDEEEVHDWIEEKLEKGIETLQPYHVSVTNAAGEEISNEGVEITIDAPKNAGDEFAVYAISSDGTATRLTTAHKNGKITFAANGASIYVVCKSVKNSHTSDLLLPVASLSTVVLSGALAVYLILKKERAVA